MKKSIFSITLKNKNVSEKQLLDEINRVAKKLKKSNITKEEFDIHSKYGSHLIVRKIGWNIAKEKAGLTGRKKEMNITDKKLIDNLYSVWVHLKRQPKKEEMIKPISKYSSSPYIYRYGTWIATLQTFVSLIKKNKIQYNKLKSISVEKPFKHKTPRNINTSLKLQVFKRDGLVCQICKRSNQTHPKLKFEVDHIYPYAEGGETVLSNLQVLCKEHNRMKGSILLKNKKS